MEKVEEVIEVIVRGMPRWAQFKDHMIDLSMVEHAVLTPALVHDDCRIAKYPMITFDMENRHYVVTYDSDEEARADFNQLWDMHPEYDE